MSSLWFPLYEYEYLGAGAAIDDGTASTSGRKCSSGLVNENMYFSAAAAAVAASVAVVFPSFFFNFI